VCLLSLYFSSISCCHYLWLKSISDLFIPWVYIFFSDDISKLPIRPLPSLLWNQHADSLLTTVGNLKSVRHSRPFINRPHLFFPSFPSLFLILSISVKLNCMQFLIILYSFPFSCLWQSHFICLECQSFIYSKKIFFPENQSCSDCTVLATEWLNWLNHTMGTFPMSSFLSPSWHLPSGRILLCN
jgi:hypothetical protein